MNSILSLLTQPSSCAGIAAIGASLANMVANTGFPTTLAGGAAYLVPLLAGVAAILRDDASSIKTP